MRFSVYRRSKKGHVLSRESTRIVGDKIKNAILHERRPTSLNTFSDIAMLCREFSALNYLSNCQLQRNVVCVIFHISCTHTPRFQCPSICTCSRSVTVIYIKIGGNLRLTQASSFRLLPFCTCCTHSGELDRNFCRN